MASLSKMQWFSALTKVRGCKHLNQQTVAFKTGWSRNLKTSYISEKIPTQTFEKSKVDPWNLALNMKDFSKGGRIFLN